ncbi:esterase E4-like [Aphidius gifuensis]|uniref:esterase E4-like n=1 Tax=Aphidius gifuensis TaxID=684658 RepID=UPI001CDCCB58|nr:esterase E4-like [Aphidius gifuensis]
MTNKSNFSTIKTVLIVTSIFPIIIITIRLLKSNPVVQPEVTIPLGKILGKYTTTRHGRVINEFIGIPYAKPPINELRFQNSVPIEPWDGIFFADNDCPICSQILENGTYVGVEDCLVINVYTPKIDTKKLLPVMVYIHGGAFVRGDSTPTSVGPDYLLDHDVVLVSMNYRLGVLGFLSTGDHFASGNFGLKDQALALKWVQQYIKYFGGNPDSVTLFGESAGGVSVNFHVLSTATKGLFHRYIAQSGSALCPWAFAESTTYKKYATLLGEKFNCPTNSSKHLIMCLQNINVFDIIHSNIFTGLQGLTGITWVPTDEPDNEDAFLTDVPLKMLLDGKIQDLPSISGGVKDEGLLVTTLLYANETMYNSLLGNFDEFLKLITDTYIPKGHSASIAKSIKDFYFEDFNVHDIAKANNETAYKLCE